MMRNRVVHAMPSEPTPPSEVTPAAQRESSSGERSRQWHAPLPSEPSPITARDSWRGSTVDPHRNKGSDSAQGLPTGSCRQPRPFLCLARPSRSAWAKGKGKAGANNPRYSQRSRYGRIWKPRAAISLAKPRTVSSETSYGSRPMFLRLARMLLGTVMIWQPQACAW